MSTWAKQKWVNALADQDMLDRHLSSTSTRKGELQRAVAKAMRRHALNDELPTAATFLFYELEQEGVVSKKPINTRTGAPRVRTERQDIADALLVLREEGLVPWLAVVDATRQLRQWNYAKTVLAYVRARLPEARIDLWDEKPPPLILCESRSMAGVLEDLAWQYLCPITGTSGQTKGYLYTDVAPLFDEDVDQQVLYIGDLDHQGGQIERNTQNVLVRAIGREIPWMRIAITAEQSESMEPIWKTDERYKPHALHEAWEAEALGQGAIKEILRATLDTLLPKPLEQVLKRENAERKRDDKRLKALDEKQGARRR